ncbi:hypothetical protein V6N13_099969 [Hibiscus sabdariffa]|uniref:Uncharacterized protein n=2 Tax=Hibiscus sabdariffa TaxID=183260 RepID=A0ABR2NLC6_9ROSI
MPPKVVHGINREVEEAATTKLDSQNRHMHILMVSLLPETDLYGCINIIFFQFLVYEVLFYIIYAKTHQWSTTSSNKSDNSDDATVSPNQNPVVSKSKSRKPSPRIVLDAIQGESNSTEDDSSSFWYSTMSRSPSQPPKLKGEPCTKKHMLPCKFISMVFKSPLRKEADVTL